jgi:hypothetical protein
MRRFIVLVAVAACGGSPAPQVASPQKCPPAATETAHASATPDGYWTGVLAGRLHLALTVRRGTYTGVLDSIDQGAKLAIENVTFDGDTLRFDIPIVKGAFQGKLDATRGRIEGTWTQLGVPQPLALDKGTAPPETNEPAPKPLDAPIDVVVDAPPIPFRAGDRTHLAYELHVSNFAHRPIVLQRLEVLAGAHTLATLEGDALASASDSGAHIASRSIATVFVWVTSTDASSPSALDNRITIRIGNDDMTTNVRVPVHATKVPVIGPPLKGRFWLAANGPSNDSAHRRALLPTGGHVHIGQRFAIDWVKPGDDGKTFTGDATKNASYHAYGAEALAASAGVVTETKDGIIENVPGPTRAVPITLATIGGNHVVIDLGGGAFAFYAHLQPGSLKVKVGEHVRRGQVLGLVGNSGNSTEPHLHFQLQDGLSPLASEGVPYAFEAFELRDGTKRKNEIPTEKELVAFP